MKILVPIVGMKTASNDEIYQKSLYEIERKTVLQYVYESLNQLEQADFIFVIKKADVIHYHLDDMIRLLVPGVKIVVADGNTSGAACSCLLAVDEIAQEEELVVAGGDQLILADLQLIVDSFRKRNLDGGVIIFEDIHPRWSYVRLDESRNVIEAAEKRPISKNATTGFYYFRRGADFIESVEKMIKKGASTSGQYYVCPCYNEMILAHQRIGTYRIDKSLYFNFNQKKGMDDYERYLKGERNA